MDEAQIFDYYRFVKDKLDRGSIYTVISFESVTLMLNLSFFHNTLSGAYS